LLGARGELLLRAGTYNGLCLPRPDYAACFTNKPIGGAPPRPPPPPPPRYFGSAG
jgi:hypothetical protein